MDSGTSLTRSRGPLLLAVRHPEAKCTEITEISAVACPQNLLLEAEFLEPSAIKGLIGLTAFSWCGWAEYKLLTSGKYLSKSTCESSCQIKTTPCLPPKTHSIRPRSNGSAEITRHMKVLVHFSLRHLHAFFPTPPTAFGKISPANIIKPPHLLKSFLTSFLCHNAYKSLPSGIS